MKAVLLVLLLANLAFYGAVRGWLGEHTRAAVVPEEREPDRIDQQIAPGRAVLLLPAADGSAREPASAPAAPTTAAPTVSAPADVAPATPAAPAASAGDAAKPGATAPAEPVRPTPAAATGPAASTAPTASTAPAALAASAASAATAGLPSTACLELTGLTLDDARRTAERVSSERLAAEATVRSAAGASTWMVHLPAYASRSEAEKAAAELRRKGVEDFFVIQDNSDLRNAISLGVYSSTEGAASRVAALAARGVKGAKTLARANGVARARVEIRQVRDAAQGALAQIAKEFPGGEWRACQPARKS